MAKQISDYVARPFEGLAREADVVAFREIVPSGTYRTRLTKEYGGQEIILATLLPGLWPAWKRSDGQVILGLQTQYSSGDASRDVAIALQKALDAEPSTSISHIDIGVPGPRLQDMIDLKITPQIEVSDRFEFWVDPSVERSEDIEKTIEQASESANPTAAIDGQEGAYWCRMGGKEFLRWAVETPENDLLDALARLHSRRESAILDGARYAGAFRACGLMVPVWELPRGTEADELTDIAAAFKKRLDAAIRPGEPLSAEERRARAGLVARQVTLR